MPSKLSSNLPKPGKIVLVTCKDIDNIGFGLSEWNKWLLVTPDLLPGEIANVEITYRHGSRWFTKLKQIINISPERIKPPCAVADDCGSCSIQHISINEQWNLKTKHLKDVLIRIAEINDPVIDYRYKEYVQINDYRNRAIIPVRLTSNRKLLFGYYRRNTHEIVDTDNCLVLDSRINHFIISIKSDLNSYLNNYSKFYTDIQCLKHISLRIGVNTGEILLTFISNSELTQVFKQLADLWFNRWKNVVGVTANIQPNDNNVIFGDKTITLIGKNRLMESLCGLRFALKTTTFFQLNTKKTEAIIHNLLKVFNQSGITTIVDCYCGVGTFSLPLSKLGYNIFGIEIHQQSIIQAKYNARINHIQNCKFFCGDVKGILDLVLDANCGLVLDPPRKGLEKNVVDIIKDKKPSLIAYLSCNPSTLARDIKLICLNNSYVLDTAFPIDFFPHTTHLETLAILVRSTS
ncbi:23S rRNA (uracil(1939)-C(5))-methyltransferase RlmD [Prochlorococcus sp. MIT 1307]|uniref:23S rRNA (uracil(1939)-C(5))-methyltransferase RlmD n=1 Tax=Prochlorococcus sp. MIT 1307 TaxID=3096219 RepID=UPI002A756C30|nr:23S rRNA (uracil(1939)-C(5))-methyltransferase RlmD [Prochlorococcus sp. MIT 1307]